MNKKKIKKKKTMKDIIYTEQKLKREAASVRSLWLFQREIRIRATRKVSHALVFNCDPLILNISRTVS